MPQVTLQGKTLECPTGANLRQVLLRAGIDLYNGAATVINCRSLGTCGTCAVTIAGAQGSVSPMGWKEKARLSLPPHDGSLDRRLACQVKVFGDIEVHKMQGFWGQGQEEVW